MYIIIYNNNNDVQDDKKKNSVQICHRLLKSTGFKLRVFPSQQVVLLRQKEPHLP